MFRRRVVLAALLLVALGPPVLRSDVAVASSDANGGCFQNAATGEAHVKVCISSHGNLSTFLAGARDFFPSAAEGYALCSDNGNTVHGWDAGDAESAWGATTQASGPVVTRTTADGALQFAQSYAFDFAQQEVTISMTVRNVGETTLSQVIVSRYAEPNVLDGGGLGDFSSGGTTGPSGFVWKGSEQGLVLSAENLRVPHRAYTETDSIWRDDPASRNGCVPTTSSLTDLAVERVNYTLGSLSPGDKKTVSVKYERV